MSQRIFLQTYGCQMNERDSEELLGMLPAPAVNERRAGDRAGLRDCRATGAGECGPPQHLLGAD